MQDKDKFINYINDNYSKITSKFDILCKQRKQNFDRDIFHDSILRCYNTIDKKKTLKDSSPYGMESYLIISYFNLVAENKRSAHNKKRDWNYTSDEVEEINEEWYNKTHTSSIEKIKSDMFKDFSVLYIMTIVQDNFDTEHFYLFRLKELTPGMTYKKLKEKTGINGVRQKVVEVKAFIKKNVSKEDIKKAFYDIYGDLLGE